MRHFNGIPIMVNELAREVRDEFKVERNPIPKRRRGWRVVKHHIDRPGCYQMGGTFVMHPEVYQRLVAQSKERSNG